MRRPLISSITQAHIDEFRLEANGVAQLRGWIFHEDTPIHRIDLRLKGKDWVKNIQLHDRPDVRDAYESFIGSRPHTARSGFDVTAIRPEGLTSPACTLIEITPYTLSGTRLLPRLTHFCPMGAQAQTSTLPPATLQERVGGTRDFIQIGAHAAAMILTCIQQYNRDFQASEILDWGCGCGRIISQMLKFIPIRQLHGCDIDSDAILWNQQNIIGPTFTRIDPYPPTPYTNSKFNIVYGISVMTHLSEETQILWLKELKRITRSGAILVISVMGEKLRAANMPPSLTKDFAKHGFVAFVPGYSDTLSEFSHAGYYKEAYHTLDYITRTWEKYFQILEYVETKHQDLVILQRA
jgi:2-polyprenyl-3-methyl-5-hydroxy-6-metoxy-1,4-benzoquinol methylase